MSLTPKNIPQLLRYNPHPHVVTDDNAATPDLMTYLSSNPNLPFSIGKRIFAEIVRAVGHIHSLGIAHRDISLENVLINHNSHCRLTGFDLATRTPLSCIGTVGKLFYIAPESLRSNAEYDGLAADVWSLGVILFILLTGNPPFEFAEPHNSHFAQFTQIGMRQYIMSWNLSNCPEHAIDLLEKVLVVSPNQRFRIQDILQHPVFLTVTCNASRILIGCRSLNCLIERLPSRMDRHMSQFELSH